MDYDGNGRLDLISGSGDCCNWDREFFVFRREANGQFRSREAIPTRGVPSFLPFIKAYIADWNGDGRPDVIVTGGLRGSLAAGPLTGHAEIELIYRIEGSEALRRQTKPNVVDWDGNGRPDLVIGGRGPEGNGVYLLRGVEDSAGARVEAPELLIAAPEGSSVNGLDAADWDGDGVLDLIVGLTWWERDEAGRRTSRSQIWVYRRVSTE